MWRRPFGNSSRQRAAEMFWRPPVRNRSEKDRTPLIGVISRPEDAEVVEECFELFKTPWEHFRAGQTYDVVISSTGDVAAVETSLLIVCRAAASDLDRACGFVPQARLDSATIEQAGTRLPIYGAV